MSEQQTEAQAPAEAPTSGQETTTEAPSQGFDASQLMERFDELKGFVQEQFQQQQPVPAYEDPYANEPQFDPYTGQPLDQNQFDPSDPQQLQQMMAQQTQQALQPIQQQLYAREFNDLVTRYPDIKDQATQQAVLGSLQQAGYDPNTMIPIPVIEMAYKAHRADSLAAQQTPASEGGEAVIEQSGAQVPQEQQDPAAMILAAARGQSNTIAPR